MNLASARPYLAHEAPGARSCKSGESGFRSRCLVVANDALYRLS
jgi:hypothetical protein